MRAERAVEKVRERLIRTCRAMEDANVPYVVIGGNAVAIWVGSRDGGAVRNTKDVDVLLNRSDLDRAGAAMKSAGFDLAVVDGVTMFLDQSDPMPSRGVHIVFTGEKIKPHHPHPAPQIVAGLRSADGVNAIDLRELLILKLNSFRDIDRVHIRDLIAVGLVDDVVANGIPSELRSRLEEIRTNPEG